MTGGPAKHGEWLYDCNNSASQRMPLHLRSPATPHVKMPFTPMNSSRNWGLATRCWSLLPYICPVQWPPFLGCTHKSLPPPYNHKSRVPTQRASLCGALIGIHCIPAAPSLKSIWVFLFLGFGAEHRGMPVSVAL